jgi:hypothetical protein
MAENDVFKKIEVHVLRRLFIGRCNNEDEKKIAGWFSYGTANEELRELSRDHWEKIPRDVRLNEYEEEKILDRLHKNIK